MFSRRCLTTAEVDSVFLETLQSSIKHTREETGLRSSFSRKNISQILWNVCKSMQNENEIQQFALQFGQFFYSLEKYTQRF